MDWIWLAGLFGAMLFFALVEGYAFRHPDREHTLSYWIAFIGSKWPFSIWICGAFAGGLAVHFFWHFGCQFGVGG